MSVVAATCNVCFEDFDSTRRVPRIFSCGHVTCTHCIKKLQSLQCPECRAVETRAKTYKELPVVYMAIPNVKIGKRRRHIPEVKTNLTKCTKHNADCHFFCQTCDLSVCNDCMGQSHRKENHKILPMEEAIYMKKKACKVDAQENLRLLKDAEKSLDFRKTLVKVNYEQAKTKLEEKKNLANAELQKKVTEANTEFQKKINEANAEFEGKVKTFEEEVTKIAVDQSGIVEAKQRVEQISSGEIDRQEEIASLADLAKTSGQLNSKIKKHHQMIGVPSRRSVRLFLEWRSTSRNVGGRFEFEFSCPHAHGRNFLENVAKKSLNGRKGIINMFSLYCTDVPRCIDGDFEEGMEELPEFKEGQMFIWSDGNFQFFYSSWRPFSVHCCVAGQISSQQLKEANFDSFEEIESIEFTSIDFVE